MADIDIYKISHVKSSNISIIALLLFETCSKITVIVVYCMLNAFICKLIFSNSNCLGYHLWYFVN